MKKILLVVIIGMLVGCGRVERTIANVTGYSTQCIDGVEYIQFASGASVAYNADGSIKKCK